MNTKIELLSLQCENFKGLRKFSVNFDGADASITAANGVGKTTVYDMFLWLLFGKDSTGRTDSGKGKFEVRPLGQDNQPVKGVDVMVQATLRIGGAEHTFKRVQKENVVKRQLRGYVTDYWIDGVPKLEKDYKPFIAEIIDEETFKVLTDLSHFNSKIHWTDRRRLLLVLAGNIGTPAGFESLVENLNGRSIDDFKKMLADQKKLYEEEQGEINPRIDEIHKGLPDYTAVDTDKLQEQRTGVERTIEELEKERTKLLNDEKWRQAKIDTVNTLARTRLQRESELKNDTSGTKSLCDEKTALEAAYGHQAAALTILQGEMGVKRASLEGAENGLAELMRTLKAVRKEYGFATNEEESTAQLSIAHTATCDRAHEDLRAAAAIIVHDKRITRQGDLAAISQRGDNMRRAVVQRKAEIEDLQGQLSTMLISCEKAEHELRDKEQANKKRFTEIDEAIKNNPKVKPEDDGQWKDFTTEIKKLQAEIGGPAAQQLETIETNRKAAHDVLNKLNESLAQADRIKADRQRIAVLELRERDLAQLIADTEKQLSEIGEYKAEMSRRIQAAVNGRFKYVEFKMFERRLNGEIDNNHCEATYRGVPYADMSTGQEIICGVDIVNVLSEYYGVSVTLFVDHAESLTLPLEAKSQTIELYAKKPEIDPDTGEVIKAYDTLEVEVKAGERTVAA